MCTASMPPSCMQTALSPHGRGRNGHGLIPPTSAPGLTNLEGLRQVVCIVPGVALVVLPWSRRFEQPPILLCIPKSAPSMSTPAVVMATGKATKHESHNQQTLTRAHKHAFAQNHVCDSHTCASNRDTTRRASQTRDTSVRHGSMARHTAHGTTRTQLHGHGHGHGHGHTVLEHGAQTRDFACARHTRHARSFTLGKSITAR